MSKYSVEEMLAIAELLREGDTDGGQDGIAAEMLTAYAERIEADKSAVPVDEYAAGWRQAARWAERTDLLADIGSPAYERDKAFVLQTPTAEPVAQGEAVRVFIEEMAANGKPTGYLNEMYGTLERSLRQRVEQDGMHGSYPDKLCIKAADAIANLRVALASQIDITNTERGHAERAAKLLAAQPRAVPDAIVELSECREHGWNDSAPAYRAGWNDCRDAYFSAQRDASEINQAMFVSPSPGESS